MLYDLDRCIVCKEIVIPENDTIVEQGEYSREELIIMLKKYKNNPDAIQFIAEMMEE